MEEKNNIYTVRVSDSFNRETEETIHYISNLNAGMKIRISMFQSDNYLNTVHTNN